MYLLICEGACNPTLPIVEAELARHSKLDPNPIGGDHLYRLQRALRYTAHFVIDENGAQCRQCSHVRAYGRNNHRRFFRGATYSGLSDR
jgi:hypothetical protein